MIETTGSLARHKYQPEIQAMMFTFGDAKVPSPAAIQLMEEIVHAQMIDLLQRAMEVAAKRGSRSLLIDDFIFLVRHDPFKVRRLKEFLSWKDIRKNVRSNTGENADEFVIGEEEDGAKGTQPESPINTKPTGRRKICLCWDYLDSLVDGYESLSNDEDSSDLEDYFNESQERLREADLITKEMTKEEYMEYSECRQASFTFKKAKKFRDWISFSKYVDAKPSDDIVEILGFLAWEIVRILTNTALKVKQRCEKLESSPNIVEKQIPFNDIYTANEWTPNGVGNTLLAKHFEFIPQANMKKGSPKIKESQTNLPSNAFQKPERRTAIKTEHIYEACRLLEKSTYIFSCFSGGLPKKMFSPIV